MEEIVALRTENLAFKRENARLRKVIDELNHHLMESIHGKADLIVDVEGVHPVWQEVQHQKQPSK